MSAPAPAPQTIAASGPLRGTVRMPGDKSISHRALMLAALAVGESRISGLLEGEDVLATAAALRAFGAQVERGADGDWRVWGVGVGGLLQPGGPLAMGNSGTSTRLLMGLAASHAVTATFVGDASLSRRPMARVITPLAQMGADIGSIGGPGATLPLTVRGIVPAVPIAYRLPVASAQVKSAVLLAGLNTPGITRVIERVLTRDHSERMLRAFGAELTVEDEVISIRGEAELRPQHVVVPGDPSSAAFWLVAGSFVPGSDLTIEHVLLNPTRTGLITVLRAMGADITVVDEREAGGEPVGDLRVRAAALTGIDVDPALVPSMIDEFPALFVAAAFAQGTTRVTGAGELRVKESDRLAAMAVALTANGVTATETADGLIIEGTAGEPIPGGGRVAVQGDHRVAMSMTVAALHATRPIALDDMSPVATSYPDFFNHLASLTGPQT